MGEPAPLIGDPPPEGAAEWVVGAEGARLRAALFCGSGRGTVVLSPGRTEPIEKYYEAVEDLRRRGFHVLVHDWRGHGLSQRLCPDRLRGHATGWRPFVEDFSRLLDAFEGRAPRPWIGLGHSMGGSLTALALLEGEGRLSAALLSAPMLGLELGGRPVVLVRALAAVLARVSGTGYATGAGDPLGGQFEGNVLTHDRARFERTRRLLEANPDLRLGGVTWGWLHFALQASLRIARGPAEQLTLPILVVAAEEERLVDNAASRAFAERLPNGRYVEIAGARHELMMETDDLRARFWAEFDRLADEVC